MIQFRILLLYMKFTLSYSLQRCMNSIYCVSAYIHEIEYNMRY